MAEHVSTIGYEGATVSAFLATLTSARIELLVDVRAVAMSRRPGFAKTALRSHLSSAGIAYLHMPALGNPKQGREAAWRGDMATFRAIFRGHLRGAAAGAAIDELAQVSRLHAASLLCMEADPLVCHRSIVADALRRRHGFCVRHLHVLEGAEALFG